MLVFVWICVMAQAFFPGGQELAAAYQAQVRSIVEEPQPVASRALVGAAEHVVRCGSLSRWRTGRQTRQRTLDLGARSVPRRPGRSAREGVSRALQRRLRPHGETAQAR